MYVEEPKKMIEEEEQENQDIYNLDFADNLLDNDEISPLESGFMMGYEKANEGGM